jgi:hypothetical protein
MMLSELRGDVVARLRELGANVRNETFAKQGRYIHDWQRYIPENVRGAWPTLSDEARGIAYLIAEQQADAEEWD